LVHLLVVLVSLRVVHYNSTATRCFLSFASHGKQKEQTVKCEQGLLPLYAELKENCANSSGKTVRVLHV
jgi:flagellar basal body-associated protein FliL